MEERLETGRRQGRRVKTCGGDILGCASSLHDGMVPSQAEDTTFHSIAVSEILVIFEWGTAHLRWQDPRLLSQLFQLVWSQSPVTLRCFPPQLAPKGMFLQAEIDACA